MPFDLTKFVTDSPGFAVLPNGERHEYDSMYRWGLRKRKAFTVRYKTVQDILGADREITDDEELQVESLTTKLAQECLPTADMQTLSGLTYEMRHGIISDFLLSHTRQSTSSLLAARSVPTEIADEILKETAGGESSANLMLGTPATGPVAG